MSARTGEDGSVVGCGSARRQCLEPLTVERSDRGLRVLAMGWSHDPRNADACAPLESLHPTDSSPNKPDAFGD